MEAPDSCAMLSVPALGVILISRSQKLYIWRKLGSYNHLNFSLVILLHNVIEGGYFRCRQVYFLILENTNQTPWTSADT